MDKNDWDNEFREIREHLDEFNSNDPDSYYKISHWEYVRAVLDLIHSDAEYEKMHRGGLIRYFTNVLKLSKRYQDEIEPDVYLHKYNHSDFERNVLSDAHDHWLGEFDYGKNGFILRSEKNLKLLDDIKVYTTVFIGDKFENRNVKSARPVISAPEIKEDDSVSNSPKFK